MKLCNQVIKLHGYFGFLLQGPWLHFNGGPKQSSGFQAFLATHSAPPLLPATAFLLCARDATAPEVLTPIPLTCSPSFPCGANSIWLAASDGVNPRQRTAASSPIGSSPALTARGVGARRCGGASDQRVRRASRCGGAASPGGAGQPSADGGGPECPSTCGDADTSVEAEVRVFPSALHCSSDSLFWANLVRNDPCSNTKCKYCQHQGWKGLN
ncbi:hypothetical protein BS78_02G155100 [Paspalum vaginatum]|nr:hypothetical protein BS78_02G155100 [Paspalum vaginatum]